MGLDILETKYTRVQPNLTVTSAGTALQLDVSLRAKHEKFSPSHLHLRVRRERTQEERNFLCAADLHAEKCQCLALTKYEHEKINKLTNKETNGIFIF